MQALESQGEAYVQTVLGRIAPERLGVTLMHEHTLSVSGVYFQPPKDPGYKRLAEEKVSQSNLWWVRYNSKSNRDNLMLDEYEVAVEELVMYADAGGGSFVDLTPKLVGPRAREIVGLSRVTGLNMIRGAGYYIEGSYPPGSNIDSRSMDNIADEIVQVLTTGDPETGIVAGIIGEIGCSWPITPNEEKVLRASAQAQARTGVSLNVHPGRNSAALAQIRDIVAEEGADLTRVILSHMDRSGYPLEARLDVLESGCVVEYDLFGQEGYYPAHVAIADGTLPNMPNDLGRVRELQELMELGFTNQLTISHDICMKMSLATYGGYGYGHILRNVVPLMSLYGVAEEQIKALLVETPRRLLTIGSE